MYDLIMAAFAGLLIAYMLIPRGLHMILVYFIAMMVGFLLGWQILRLWTPSQTLFRFLLQTNPQLQLIWDSTHDLVAVAEMAKYGLWLMATFDAFAALFGAYAAKLLLSRKQG